MKNEKQYVEVFDVNSVNSFIKDRNEFNILLLKDIQQRANEVLKEKGYLYLNEVYEMLGMYRTKTGQLVGWLYNDYFKDEVDFGIDNECNKEFIKENSDEIIVSFNTRIINGYVQA